MRLLSGTSGFSYKEWRGGFYPEDLPAREMLRYYAERLPAVEINNTFYRMPRAEMLDQWAEQVPDRFVFVLKASRRITHMARLADAGDSVDYFWKQGSRLGARLGPVLFQLPPNFRKDLDRLRGFVERLPGGCRGAFEFRHPSWLEDDEVLEILRASGHALCAADSGEREPVLAATADWGYLRLRRDRYTDAELERWAARIQEQPWEEVYVFFKHEDEATAPALAARLTAFFSAERPDRGSQLEDHPG